MAFCQNCGNLLADDVAFCSKCGTPINGGGQFTPTPGHAVVMVKPKIPGRGLGISSMVLGIIGLVYSFGMLISVIDIIDSWSRYMSDDALTSVLGPLVVFSILSILSICFAPAALHRGYRNGISISGVIMGIVGLAGYIASILLVLSEL